MKESLEFTSHPGNLLLVRRFVRRSLECTGLEEHDLDMVILGIDEACSNIIRHAYQLREDGVVKLSVRAEQEGVTCVLRDYGKKVPSDLIRGRNLGEVRPGGLGIHFIQHAFDHVEYRAKPRGTELHLFKSVQSPRSKPKSKRSA